MYPYVDGNGLHCGVDGSTDLSIVEIPSGQLKMYSIVCNAHKKSGNHVCGIDSLMNILDNYFVKNKISKKDAIDLIHKICDQISTNFIKVSYDEINKRIDIQ